MTDRAKLRYVRKDHYYGGSLFVRHEQVDVVEDGAVTIEFRSWGGHSDITLSLIDRAEVAELSRVLALVAEDMFDD